MSKSGKKVGNKAPIKAQSQRKPVTESPNDFDKPFRQLLSLFIMNGSALDPKLGAVYHALMDSLASNRENTGLFGRVSGSPTLFAAIKEIPGLKLENGQFNLEKGHTITYMK